MTSAVPNKVANHSRSAAIPSPAFMAGAIIIGSILVGAVLFRTHGYEVTPFTLELVRHFSVLFMACELTVVWLALRSGLDVAGVWQRLAGLDKLVLLVWLATFWISSVLSEQPAYSLITVSSWPIHLLFGLAVYHLAARTRVSIEQSTRWAGTAIVLVLVGLFIITAVHFTHIPDPSLLPNGQVFWPGAIPGFMGVRLFGVVMTYAALFGAGMLLAGRQPSNWPLPVALLILGFGAMCWSSTRAALPAFFAALLVVPLVSGCRPTRTSWLVVTAALVTACLLSALVPAPDGDYGLMNLFGQDTIASGDVTAGRIDMWRAVVGAIAERPFIGHGEGSTRWLIEQERGAHVQPHDIVLQVLLHWGAVAAVAAAWLVGRMLLAMIAAVRRDQALLPYAMIVTAAFVTALFDGALYYPQMVMLPVAALAVVLAPRPLDNATPQPLPPEPSAPAR